MPQNRGIDARCFAHSDNDETVWNHCDKKGRDEHVEKRLFIKNTADLFGKKHVQQHAETCKEGARTHKKQRRHLPSDRMSDNREESKERELG